MELLTIEELEARCQVFYVPSADPTNEIKNCSCPICHCNFSCTADLKHHRKNVKCYLVTEERAGWRRSRKDTCDWIAAEKVPHIVKAIREGHYVMNGYRYWLFGDDKFGRVLTEAEKNQIIESLEAEELLLEKKTNATYDWDEVEV